MNVRKTRNTKKTQAKWMSKILKNRNKKLQTYIRFINRHNERLKKP